MTSKMNKLVSKLKNGVYIKTVALLLAVLFLSCGSVGGTIAWMVSQTDVVINTFTYGKIDITLTETETNIDEDEDTKTNTYEITPGDIIVKDPTITIKAGSEACWLFVKLEKSSNFNQYLGYTMADGWILLDSDNGIYYREIGKTNDTEDVNIPVLKDNKVTVNEGVTKEVLNGLEPENYPTLKVTAYAVQYSTELETIDTAAEAWELINPVSAE